MIWIDHPPQTDCRGCGWCRRTGWLHSGYTARNENGPHRCSPFICLARPAGFKPTTPWFVRNLFLSRLEELRAPMPEKKNLMLEAAQGTHGSFNTRFRATPAALATYATPFAS